MNATSLAREKVQDARIALALAMAQNAAASSTSFFTNLTKIGLFVVTDPAFAGGADPTGVANSAPAINATQAAATAAGGSVYFPPGTYKTLSPLLAATARWIGVPERSILLAGAPMQTVSAFSGESFVRGMTFNANRQARIALARVGDTDSNYSDCAIEGGLLDGVRSAMGGVATIGPVNQTGAGPSLTITQMDPLFLELGGTHDFLKITGAGPLGTATFQTSTNGGVSYSGIDQTLFAQTQIAVVGSNIKTGSGLLITAEPGAFVHNTTYDFTLSTVLNANNNARFSKCIARSCGAVYATAGFLADYPSNLNPALAPGTVTTVAGSQIVTGSGTSFLSMGARDGDAMRINGQRFMISAVLNDFQIALDFGAPPQFSLAGLDYAISTGAGFWEDVETGNQLGSLLEQCIAMQCVQGMRFGGLGGPTLIAPVVSIPAITAITIGTHFED